MKISFCITCYDKDYFLLDNLLTILQKQTVAPDELIVYSSGIGDVNIFKIKNIIINKTQVDIIYINNSQRTMQSIARNVCAGTASGDVIIFFDVDDIPHFQKIEITKNLFINHQIDFIVHNYSTNELKENYIDISNSTLKQDLATNSSNTNIYSLSNNGNIHHAHIAVKKKCFNKVKFNESFEFYRKEDGKFCQDLLQNNFKGLYINEELVLYTS